MSELQDKLDRGKITPQEFFDAWDLEMKGRNGCTLDFTSRCMIFGWPSVRATARVPTNFFLRSNSN
jgi:hypothetical protein